MYSRSNVANVDDGIVQCAVIQRYQWVQCLSKVDCKIFGEYWSHCLRLFKCVTKKKYNEKSWAKCIEYVSDWMTFTCLVDWIWWCSALDLDKYIFNLIVLGIFWISRLHCFKLLVSCKQIALSHICFIKLRNIKLFHNIWTKKQFCLRKQF